ncbi:(2Fe-2S)-binding protein [Lacisediminimonas profundi]|uniref:(2Fe-2S)-binding protein n=1 Tax=Lacisediminimonas profundi TaxID=2603856 RepID=UPI00124B8BA8|nr:(2Fe-2S)-binding protein [Lacisediminimonas profundi]
MIVCVCNNVSDRKIRAAVDEGLTSMRELRSELEVGTCCGKCHACAKQVLRECLDEKLSAVPVFFQSGALAA